MTTIPFRRLHLEAFPGMIGKVGIALAVALLMALGLMLPDVAGVPLDRSITVIAVPMLFLVTYLIWQNERLWIFASVISHLMMMLDSTRDAIGIGELSFGLFGILGLALWFMKEVAIHRRRIILTGFDLLLLSFIVVSSITTLIANVLNGGNLLLYFKEYGVFVDLLLYFPLRKAVNRKEDVIVLLILFIVVALANGFVGFLTYKERLAQAVFQWQVTASRSNINESTSLALFILASTMFAYSRKIWLQIVSLALAGGGLVFLLVSFSRSPIVSAVLALIVMIFLSPLRNGRRVTVAIVFALLAGVGVAYLVFPDIVTNLGTSLSQRILSVASTTSDRSFNARLVESSSIINNYFVYSPIIGLGFGTSFKFLDPLTNETVQGVFVHNGYIWGLFKLGAPLALMLLGLMVYPLVRLLLVAPKRHDGMNRALMAGAVGYLLCSFMVHFTSNLFTQVSTILNIVICWVLLDYVQRQVLARREQREVAVTGSIARSDEGAGAT